MEVPRSSQRTGKSGACKSRDPHQDRTATLQLSPEMIMSLVNGMDIDLGMISGVYDPADAEQLKQKAKELFSAGEHRKSAFVYAYAAYKMQHPSNTPSAASGMRKFDELPNTLGTTGIPTKEQRDFVAICNSNAAQALLHAGEFAGAMHHADEALGLQWVHTKSVWRRVEAYKRLGLYDSAKAILKTLDDKHLIPKKANEISALEQTAPRPPHILHGFMRCQLISQAGTLPQARWKGGAVIGGDKLYLIGGSTYDKKTESRGFQVYIFDLPTNTWIEQLRFGGTQNPPVGLHAFSTIYHDGSIVVFGGHTTICESSTPWLTNGLWEFLPDVKLWLQIPSVGKRPRARQGHSAVLHNNKMWVFGGVNQELLPMNDLWSFDLNTRRWSEIHPRGNDRPDPRFEAFTCVHAEGRCMYVYGGGRSIQNEDFLCDLWRFSFPTKTWHLLDEKLTIPAFQGKCTGRANGHAFVAELPAIGPVLFLLAGYQHSCYFATMYAYELQQRRLRVVDWTSDSQPLLASCGHAMCVHPQTGSVYLWGGANSTVLFNQMYQVSYMYNNDPYVDGSQALRDFLTDVDGPLQDLVPSSVQLTPEAVQRSRQLFLAMLAVHNKMISNSQPRRSSRDEVRAEIRQVLHHVERDPILSALRLQEDKPVSIKYATYALNLRSVLGCIARESNDLREAEEQFTKIYRFLRDNERCLTPDMVEMQRRVLDNLCGLYFESKDENKWIQCMHEYRRCCPDDPMLAMMVDDSIMRIAYSQLQDKPRVAQSSVARADPPSKSSRSTSRGGTEQVYVTAFEIPSSLFPAVAGGGKTTAARPPASATKKKNKRVVKR